MKKEIIKWILILLLGTLIYIFILVRPPCTIHSQHIIQVDTTSYYDSISMYDNFNDIPAGLDTVILIDGVIYKPNNDKTLWTPTYTDEDVMWIGGDGDTIWE